MSGSGSSKIPFKLQGAPWIGEYEFVDRPLDMLKLEHALLPGRDNDQQKIFVLFGPGGIGKTQLAIEFARRHHQRFSLVIWLDGRSEDKLKQSIASHTSQIPDRQISKMSRNYVTTGKGDIDMVIREVIGWLTKSDHIDWLLVFDNVDPDYYQRKPQLRAYDITRYFPAGHGSILVTTRRAQLAYLGDSNVLNKVNRDQAQDILEGRYGGAIGEAAFLLIS
jgi:hypothetical protein